MEESLNTSVTRRVARMVFFLFIGWRSKGRNPFVSTGLRSFFRSTSTGPISRLSACLLTFLFVLWQRKNSFVIREFVVTFGGWRGSFDRNGPSRP